MERYRAAIRAYKEATTALTGTSNQDQFERAYEFAEGVRLLFERARTELREHMKEHGC